MKTQNTLKKQTLEKKADKIARGLESSDADIKSKASAFDFNPYRLSKLDIELVRYDNFSTVRVTNPYNMFYKNNYQDGGKL